MMLKAEMESRSCKPRDETGETNTAGGSVTWDDHSGGSDGRASVCNVGDLGSIPGLGSSLVEGNGNPLQYSCLENPMDGGAWCPWGCKELDTTERLHSLMILQAASELIFVAETVS